MYFKNSQALPSSFFFNNHLFILKTTFILYIIFEIIINGLYHKIIKSYNNAI